MSCSDPDAQDFWNGVELGALVLQECSTCERFRFPPMPSCPYCASAEATTREVSGRGVIHSWVTTYHPFSESHPVPMVTGTIVLDEGPRIFAEIECNAEQLVAGLPVAAVFPRASSGGAVYPKFVPQ